MSNNAMSENTVTDRVETSEDRFLKYLGRSNAEQEARQMAAMQILDRWMNEEVSPEQNENNRAFFADFQEIVDRERLPGHKLFTVE
jgi:hypothetical protein